MSTLYCFLVGAAGAAAYELIQLYVLMGKLSKRKFMALFSSSLYGIVTLGLIVASGFIAWGINANTDPTPWQLIMSGIGARSLVSKPAEARFARGGATLGSSAVEESPVGSQPLSPPSQPRQLTPPTKPRITLRDIFAS